MADMIDTPLFWGNTTKCFQDVSGDGRHLLTGSYRDQACDFNFLGPKMGLVYFIENPKETWMI
jgi:hypothetical protein